MVYACRSKETSQICLEEPANYLERSRREKFVSPQKLASGSSRLGTLSEIQIVSYQLCKYKFQIVWIMLAWKCFVERKQTPFVDLGLVVRYDD